MNKKCKIVKNCENTKKKETTTFYSFLLSETFLMTMLSMIWAKTFAGLYYSAIEVTNKTFITTKLAKIAINCCSFLIVTFLVFRFEQDSDCNV